MVTASEDTINHASGGWLNNPQQLETAFRAAVVNWKGYVNSTVPRNTVVIVNALYKQATAGDAPPIDEAPLEALGKQIWERWRRLRGTPEDTAKRRYLTYLRSIDKRLVSVTDENAGAIPPIDFCKDHKTGARICAWCNSTAGCAEILLNADGAKPMLDEVATDPLHLENFRRWFEAYESVPSKCKFGLHVGISKVEARQFQRWFDQPLVNGFRQFDSTGELHPMLREVLQRQCQTLYERQLEYRSLCDGGNDKHAAHNARDALIAQTDLVEGLQDFFKEKVGKSFVFEVPCERTSGHCHSRRVAAGGQNHNHPIELKRPAVDFSVYEEASMQREQAVGLGVAAATAPCRNTKERCSILKSRISDFRGRQQLSVAAKQNQIRRVHNRPRLMKDLADLANSKMVRLLEDALTLDQCDDLTLLVSRGAPVNHESKIGMTPLIRCTILSKRIHAEELVELGASPDYSNAEGMTALMWACKRDDLVMVHTLLDLGARPDFESPAGLTGIGVAVRHGRTHALEVMIEYELHFSVDRILNEPSNLLGTTPLNICVRHCMRNMARKLIKMGAKIDNTNALGQTAVDVAKMYGQKKMENWLKTKKHDPGAAVQDHVDEQEENDERIAIGNLLLAVQENDVNEIVQIVFGGLVAPDYELECGMTPLIAASRAGNIDAVKSLLRSGCDCTYKNRFGRTALMASSSPGVTVLLLDKNEACLDMRDLDGNSALTFASSRRDQLICNILLSCRQKGVRETLKSYPDSFESGACTEEGLCDYAMDESWKWRLQKGHQH